MGRPQTTEKRFGSGDLLLILFLLVCLGCLGWPGYMWFGAKIEPTVFGLPFSLAWVTGWAIAAFLGLVFYDASRKR